jgi:CRP-like cAMP-binding protein
MTATPFKNTLLQHLPSDVIQRLHLRQVKLEVGREIEFPGSSIDHLFFIEEGIGSMTTTFKDGSQVEVGMFGYESVVGVSALMGTKRSLNRIHMQLAGHGFSSRVELAKVEFNLCADFHDLALRYVQAQLTQATQSAGCNRKHDVEQRLARWLLICVDRANARTFPMSQEFIADMLGVTRSSVSVVAGQLKEQGLIEYSRGILHVPNSHALEEKACECYQIVKQHLDNYAEFDTGFVV